MSRQRLASRLSLPRSGFVTPACFCPVGSLGAVSLPLAAREGVLCVRACVRTTYRHGGPPAPTAPLRRRPSFHWQCPPKARQGEATLGVFCQTPCQPSPSGEHCPCQTNRIAQTSCLPDRASSVGTAPDPSMMALSIPSFWRRFSTSPSWQREQDDEKGGNHRSPRRRFTHIASEPRAL